MRKYNSYKDSGVEWIGEIPISWEKTKLKFTLEGIVTGGTPDTSNDTFWGDEENGINWISISDITSNGREILETKKFISQEGLDSKRLEILPIGSLIYSIYGSIGKVSRLGIPSTIHQGILGLKTNSYLESIFLEYYLIYFKKYVSLFSSSNTQENLNQDKVSNFEIPLPPLSEQQHIVSFLDTKTSLIDSLIEKTQRKIELLKEKRTSLINEVVTKGLNPNVEMKDSGVEWIGEIPSHWTRNKLNRISERIGDGLHSTPKYVDSSEYYFINGNNLVNGEIKIFDSTKCVSEEEFKKHFIQLNKKTLLLSINGTIGNLSFYNDEKVILGKSSCYVNLRENTNHHFIYYVLKSESISKYFTFELTGTTIFNLSLNSIRNTPIVVPPENEQQQIVEYLDEQTQKIDKTISIEEKRIELLKEYRQSLISEVVTGKRKVVE